MKFLAKGKRGIVYTDVVRGKKVAVKKKNPESKAIERIENEYNFLKILNKKNIGPKILYLRNNELTYEFVEGDFIIDFLKKSNKKDILKIIKNIFNQLYIMDKLSIDKEEMHHPYKHIIVNKNKATLIDFERCRKTLKPKNVTQFCQFLISKKISDILKGKNIKIPKSKVIEATKIYKSMRSRKNINEILALISH